MLELEKDAGGLWIFILSLGLACVVIAGLIVRILAIPA